MTILEWNRFNFNWILQRTAKGAEIWRTLKTRNFVEKEPRVEHSIDVHQAKAWIDSRTMLLEKCSVSVLMKKLFPISPETLPTFDKLLRWIFEIHFYIRSRQFLIIFRPLIQTFLMFFDSFLNVQSFLTPVIDRRVLFTRYFSTPKNLLEAKIALQQQNNKF